MALADLAACTRVVQVYAPDSLNGSITSSEIDVTGYYEALLIVSTGDMGGSSSTLDCKIQAASTTGGSLSDITGAAITQQVQGVDDNTIVAGRVLCNGTDPFWKLVTVTTAASEVGVSMVLIPYDTGNSSNTTMDFTV